MFKYLNWYQKPFYVLNLLDPMGWNSPSPRLHPEQSAKNIAPTHLTPCSEQKHQHLGSMTWLSRLLLLYLVGYSVGKIHHLPFIYTVLKMSWCHLRLSLKSVWEWANYMKMRELRENWIFRFLLYDLSQTLVNSNFKV